MEFSFKRPYEGNEKPLMQHVLGDKLTEWRVADDRNGIVREQKTIHVVTDRANAGTFFLGGFETTRDELAEYVEEAREVNKVPKPDRLPEIQSKIERLRERHAAAIEAAIEWEQKGYKLPKQTMQQRRALAVPMAMGQVLPNGKIEIIGVRNG